MSSVIPSVARDRVQNEGLRSLWTRSLVASLLGMTPGSAFTKAEAALKRLGLQPRLPVTAAEVFRFRDEYIQNRNLLAWSFVHPSHPAEIVDVLIAEDLADCRAVKVPVKGRTLPVVSKKDLIRMKMRRARPQDLEDVAALKRLEK